MQSIPLVNRNTGELTNERDSCLIYYYKDMVMFRFPFTHQVYSASDAKNVVIDTEETRLISFVYQENTNTGLRYDSLKIKSGTSFNVDSLLIKRAYKGVKFYDATNDVLVKSITQDDGTVLRKYIPKVKFDESYNDTTLMYFGGEFNGINFSLSKEADSLFSKKLVELKMVYNAVPNGINGKIDIPKKQFVFKIRKIKIKNLSEIQNIFKRFRSESSQISSKR